MRRVTYDDKPPIGAASDVLTVKQAARYLTISESSLRKMIKDRQIPFNKLRRRYVFSRAQIDDWLKRTSIPPEPTREIEAKNTVASIASELWKEAGNN